MESPGGTFQNRPVSEPHARVRKLEFLQPGPRLDIVFSKSFINGPCAQAALRAADQEGRKEKC